MNFNLSNGLSRINPEAELLHKIHSCCFGTLVMIFFMAFAICLTVEVPFLIWRKFSLIPPRQVKFI